MFKKDAGIAMKASKAYQDIIDALLEAKYAVNNASMAADVAYEKVIDLYSTKHIVRHF